MKKLAHVLLVLVLIIAAALGGDWLYVKTLPSAIDGKLTIPTLSQGATITRDPYGVSHITSANRYDLSFAFGYTQAS